MKKRITKSNVVVLLGLTLGVSFPSGLSMETPANPKVGTIRGVTTATMIVPVKPERVWEVLTNYETTGIKMPDIQDAKVLARNGNFVKLSQVYKAPYTFGLKISAVLGIKETPKNKIEYELLRGELIRSLKGTWSISPVSEGTLVRHIIKIEPELPDVLRPLFFDLSETNLDQSMKLLRKMMMAASSRPLEVSGSTDN